jgi:hypothetical protein
MQYPTDVFKDLGCVRWRPFAFVEFGARVGEGGFGDDCVFFFVPFLGDVVQTLAAVVVALQSVAPRQSSVLVYRHATCSLPTQSISLVLKCEGVPNFDGHPMFREGALGEVEVD